MIDKDYLNILKDPRARSCITCAWVNKNINDEPCRACIHSGDMPGRDRPMWRLKDGLNAKVFGPEAVKAEDNGQMRLF